jgi:hypothetical protein
MVADRWFRGWGAAALLALLATGAMLALSLEAWRAPFVLAHLCALLALVPLGVVLVVRTFARYRAERGSLLGGVRGTLAHDRGSTLLVAVALVAVVVSLSQFDGGVRAVRSAANLTTVAMILVLVGRYLMIKGC